MQQRDQGAVVAHSAAVQVILRWRAPFLTPLSWGFARNIPRASPPLTITATYWIERHIGHAAAGRASSVRPWPCRSAVRCQPSGTCRCTSALIAL